MKPGKRIGNNRNMFFKAALFIAGFFLLFCACRAEAMGIGEYRALRREALERERRIIWNSDGADIFGGYGRRVQFDLDADRDSLAEQFINVWTAPLAGTHVDAIFYCTMGGFGVFRHYSQRGDIRSDRDNNITVPLVEKGTSPLGVHVDFGRQNDMEIFASFRMNDTHDAAPDRELSRIKKENIQHLLSSEGVRPPHGMWSSVDYGKAAVRDLVYGFLEEVCVNYDIDGIELDFFRHPVLFRHERGEPVGEAELEMMTGLLRRVREMTEQVGMEKGRPILVAVRVPDSLEYCRAIGLDLEAWLSEGLIDIMTVSGYFRLNPWSYSAELGRKYGVKVYAGLSETRVGGGHHAHPGRASDEAYRGRAMSAWASGMDGIYTFNLFNTRRAVFSQMGEPRAMEGLDKFYYLSVRGGKPGAGNPFPVGEYINIPTLNPDSPRLIQEGETFEADLLVGDDPAVAVDEGRGVVARVHLQVEGVDSPDQVEVRMNDRLLERGVLDGDGLVYDVDPARVRAGMNRFAVLLLSAADGSPGTEKWDMEYRGDHVMSMPGQLPWRRLGGGRKRVEEVRDGALFLADRGTGEHENMVHLMYPWFVVPGDETVVEARVKVGASDDPRAVTVRVANGRAVEYLTLSPGEIGLYYAGIRHEMDTTSAFHTYRIVMKGRDIRVYVDDKPAMDGAGLLTTPAGDRSRWLPLRFGHDSWNERSLLFGSASALGAGEAYWKFIRYRTATGFLTLKDLAVKIGHNSERD